MKPPLSLSSFLKTCRFVAIFTFALLTALLLTAPQAFATESTATEQSSSARFAYNTYSILGDEPSDSAESLSDCIRELSADASLDSQAAQEQTSAAKQSLVIALDPGHGGAESGAGLDDLWENAVNYEIALACKAELEEYYGVTVVLTRDAAEKVGLTERVNRAVAAGADAFISLHCNACEGHNAYGAEVWVPNEASYEYTGTHLVGSALGGSILRELVNLGIARRGIYMRDCTNEELYPDGSLSDYYTVINEARRHGIPGIIVEHGFIDNPQDAAYALISTEEGRKQLGIADATGIAAYYNLSKKVTTNNVIELYGETQYDTAAAEALYSFQYSEYAIIASGVNGIDALSATALAGALNCPILLSTDTSLPNVTADALQQLGVTHAIVVGGQAALSADVLDAARAICGTAERIWGYDLIDTQLAIYEYGLSRNLWGSTVIVAQGVTSYADALSLSPLAYKLKAPVFLVSADGMLKSESMQALLTGNFTHAIAGGGTSVVSERTLGVLDAAVLAAGGNLADVVRLGGETLYDTSALIATWAVEQGILGWDNAAFATGIYMSDALAGSAVQARDSSVLLLVDYGCETGITAAAAHKDEISSIKFFGGPAVVSNATRMRVIQALDIKLLTQNDPSDYDLTVPLSE